MKFGWLFASIAFAASRDVHSRLCCSNIFRGARGSGRQSEPALALALGLERVERQSGIFFVQIPALLLCRSDQSGHPGLQGNIQVFDSL